MSFYNAIVASVCLAVVVLATASPKWSIDVRVPVDSLNSTHPSWNSGINLGYTINGKVIFYNVSAKLEGPQDDMVYQFYFYTNNQWNETNFTARGQLQMLNYYDGDEREDATKYTHLSKDYLDTFNKNMTASKPYVFLNKTLVMDPRNGWTGEGGYIRIHQTVAYRSK
jgi:hypothetical protein